jgi:hypothetical protein
MVLKHGPLPWGKNAQSRCLKTEYFGKYFGLRRLKDITQRGISWLKQGTKYYYKDSEIEDGWAGYIARKWETRSAYGILVKNPLGKRPLGRQRRRCEYKIRILWDEVVRTGGACSSLWITFRYPVVFFLLRKNSTTVWIHDICFQFFENNNAIRQ